MTVTITCDHRHIYGADAAEFLKDLADLLENNVQSLTMG
jgi:pyruvate dehydrogenase E2 component (dihydrolipoamide acetyltransferase)